ncbi:MAG TPA: YbaB/EbfC family nucleoid-associated protein [Actinomycetota bacterium]
MMKQVAKMQAELAKAQEQLAEETVEGTAGGGVVRIELSGQGEVTGVKIEAAAMDPDDPSLLEDLVMAAFNEAMRAQQALQAKRLGGLTGGLGIPGLG